MCHLTKNKEVQKMKLGELRPAVEKKDRKRLGRGIGSGNGKTAGKGLNLRV